MHVHTYSHVVLTSHPITSHPITSHPIAGGIKPHEYDWFHELVMLQELSRCGSGGVCWGIVGGLAIGLP
jgi:hypothetical protein